jgi:hypothetical protein
VGLQDGHRALRGSDVEDGLSQVLGRPQCRAFRQQRGGVDAAGIGRVALNLRYEQSSERRFEKTNVIKGQSGTRMLVSFRVVAARTNKTDTPEIVMDMIKSEAPI